MTFPSQATFGPTSHQGAGVRGAADEVLRRMLETMIQEAIEREFERFLGAGPWERTPSRRGWRNGRKRRTLKTRVGTLELRVALSPNSWDTQREAVRVCSRRNSAGDFIPSAECGATSL